MEKKNISFSVWEVLFFFWVFFFCAQDIASLFLIQFQHMRLFKKCGRMKTLYTITKKVKNPHLLSALMKEC